MTISTEKRNESATLENMAPSEKKRKNYARTREAGPYPVNLILAALRYIPDKLPGDILLRIEYVLNNLPEVERKVLVSYYKNKFTTAKIGEDFGVSSEQAFQIRRGALQMLRSAKNRKAIERNVFHPRVYPWNLVDDVLGYYPDLSADEMEAAADYVSESLLEDERAMVSMRYKLEMTDKDIGRYFGMSAQKARSAMSYIICNKLRQIPRRPYLELGLEKAAEAGKKISRRDRYKDEYPHNLMFDIYEGHKEVPEAGVDDVIALVDKLKPRYGHALLRRYKDHKTLVSIGAEDGITREAVRSTIAKALRQLRKVISENVYSATLDDVHKSAS